MVHALFSDIAGKLPEVQSDQTRKFFATWFEPEDKVTLAMKATPKPANGSAFIHATYPAKDLQEITHEELHEAIFLPQEPITDFASVNKPRMLTMYHTVNPVIEDAQPYHRGGLSNVESMIGLYADLDVKTGCFENETQALRFLDSLPLKPTIVVGSGSGGVHAYWKFSTRMGREEGWMQAVWSKWLQDYAGGIKIDQLKDTSRILKSPGALRFGDKLGEVWQPVPLIFSDGPTYEFNEFVAITEESRGAVFREEKANKLVAKNRNEKVEAYFHEKMSTNSGTMGDRIMMLANIEEIINDVVDWENDILIPGGWTKTATYSDGTEQFQRPGADSRASKRSATINWPGGSPNVLSLLTEAPETLLQDIKEAGEPLSKMRCLLRIIYLDDYKAMVDDVVSGKFKK